MLKPISVKIKNFQSIEDLEFEINGFTTITGKTNIGKSAIVRAISSSILNNTVIGMVRTGASFASVEIDGGTYSYKWEKGEKGVNRYYINGKILDKTGAKQIEEIKSHGFKSVEIGNSESYPWFASQFFPIFLLDKTGGQVTDFISEVSRLDVIQNAILLSAKKKRQFQDKTNEVSERLKSEKESLKKYSHLSNVESLYNDLLGQKESIDQKQDKLKSIEQHKSRLDTKASSVRSVMQVTKVAIPSDIEGVSSLKDGILYCEKISKNKELIRGMESVSAVVVPDVIPEYHTLDMMGRHLGVRNQKLAIARIEASLVEVPTDVNEVKKLEQMKILLADLNRISAEISTYRQEILKIETDLSPIVAEIDQIKVCPSCSQPCEISH